jgi:hypothetical protein
MNRYGITAQEENGNVFVIRISGLLKKAEWDGYVELNYSRGGGRDEFGIDLRAKGPYLGLTILF